MGNQYQKMPLKYLEETVARYNALADSGTDEDFEKPVLHRIDTAPFYAAIVPIGTEHSYGGLRINGKAQVVDRRGEVILGLFAGGEASGGGEQHGLAEPWSTATWPARTPSLRSLPAEQPPAQIPVEALSPPGYQCD